VLGLSPNIPDTMTDAAAALAAAVALAASSIHTPAPALGSPTGLRVWTVEVAIWRSLTPLPPHQQAATLIAAMTGVVKRLALTVPADTLASAGGVTALCTVLGGRCGGAGGTTPAAAAAAVRACVWRGGTIVDYVVAFDEALAGCVDAGCPPTDAARAERVLQQAALGTTERAAVRLMASNGTGAPATYASMTRALLVLFAGTNRRVVAARSATRARRRAPRASDAGGGGDVLCEYCNRVGHVQPACRMRARHFRERGRPSPVTG